MLEPEADYAERLLWAAVIKRAIDDYRTVVRYRSQGNLSKAEAQRLSKIYNHGSDPEKWIFESDSGFEDICRYVGLNPDHARASRGGDVGGAVGRAVVDDDDLEHIGEHGPGRLVAFGAHGPRVGVLDGGLTSLELHHGPPDSVEDVDRLEARHDDRHAVPGGDSKVLVVSHHGADVPRRQKSLNPVVRGAKNRLHRRGHQHVRAKN